MFLKNMLSLQLVRLRIVALKRFFIFHMGFLYNGVENAAAAVPMVRSTDID